MAPSDRKWGVAAVSLNLPSGLAHPKRDGATLDAAATSLLAPGVARLLRYPVAGSRRFRSFSSLFNFWRFINTMLWTNKCTLQVSLIALLVFAQAADACTRFVYLGPNGRVLTGRSMDWKSDIFTNLWVFPRGMERDGAAGPTSLRWTSKYGSVVASAYEGSSSDGMNEAGLMMNMLWLVESEYPEPDGQTPTMALSIWGQYYLDQFATVAEAVADARKNGFLVVTGPVPGEERLATVHLSFSDPSGDSAIFEYINGKIVIHHSREFQVMTNSPTYDEQLALVKYWESIGGEVMLPGTNRAADRFARASFYVRAIPQTDDRLVATAGVFSVIRNASVPWGISTPDQPNISSTRWRTVADHKDKIYYFESAMTPNVFWVDLKQVNFEAGSGSRVLRLGPNQSRILSGEVSSQFEQAPPFKFIALE
jgi:penicillin V acylase-like amidase (Ntn superfamily)